MRVGCNAGRGDADWPVMGDDRKSIADAMRWAVERHATGDIEAAAEVYRQVLAAEPEHYDATRLLGVAHRQRGRLIEAMKLFRGAVALSPQMAPAYCDLGEGLRDSGELDEATGVFEMAAKLAPRWALPLAHLGMMQLGRGLSAEASGAFLRVLAIEPNHVVALNNLALLLKADHQYEQAGLLLRRAIANAPRTSDLFTNLGSVLMEQGRLEAGIEAMRTAVQLEPAIARPRHNLLHTLLYSCRVTPEAVFAEHEEWGRQFAPMVATHRNTCDPERRLRIGYVSPDFRQHPVPLFLEPILANHDRSFCEVTCYSDGRHPDAVTDRLRGYPQRWRDIAAMNTEEFAALVRSDEIDILVDLAVHSGDNRLPAFALKPAPVQMTYLGYAASSGLPAMDYRLTDAVVDPPGMTEHLHTETLLRLPETFWCYQAPREVPEPSTSLGRSDAVMFGSLNRLAKIGEAVVALWSDILKRLPASRLTLMATGLSDESVRADFRGRFAAHGIAVERIRLLGPVPGAEYFKCAGEIDIALDPFPFNGGTTTCNMLWMGVPVVTMAGNSPVSRVGASVLSNVGLTDLIARDSEDYVAIAVNLARDLPRRQQLRCELRERMKGSPLCDGPRFVRHLELAYREVWRNWCQSQTR